MTFELLVEQLLNGLQLGFMLFLMSAGLTLIFGVMGLINLAHGSFYMIGAFSAAAVTAAFGSFWASLLASLIFASICLLYTSPSPRDVEESRMPSSA